MGDAVHHQPLHRGVSDDWVCSHKSGPGAHAPFIGGYPMTKEWNKC